MPVSWAKTGLAMAAGPWADPEIIAGRVTVAAVAACAVTAPKAMPPHSAVAAARVTPLLFLIQTIFFPRPKLALPT